MSTCGIVVAAGRGDRFGGAKASALLGGIPLWERARDALGAGGVERVLVVGEGPDGIPGGARRRDSVWAGLERLPGDVTHVLVHDAARPLATATLVRRVLARLMEGTFDGVVPGIPLRDTVKRVDDGRVVETLDRSRLMAVQTPQGFLLEPLVRAHRATDEDAPDDAALVEQDGGVVAVVEGEATNLKITYPEDLAVAEALLR